jgi:hypothetical protein
MAWRPLGLCVSTVSALRSEKLPSAAHRSSAATAPKSVRGRPFPPGQSGNPGGQPSLFKIYAAEFGELSPVEVVELRRAVKLLRQAERANYNHAVRLTREAREWLDGIRARRASKRQSDIPAFDRYVAEKAAAR